jgi:hypothetical protein
LCDSAVLDSADPENKRRLYVSQWGLKELFVISQLDDE